MKETAKAIKERFVSMGFDIPVENIEARLEELVMKFKVPINEAQRSVTNYFLKEYNVPKNDFYARQTQSHLVKISDIIQKGEWVNLKCRAVQLWENSHESIAQVGLVGDETGIIKFISWKNANAPEIEPGSSYMIKNAVVNEWNGKLDISFNKSTHIEKIDEDIHFESIENIQDHPESELMNIADINEKGKWINVRGKIGQLWENSHESIAQVGILGDETGSMKFTIWKDTQLPEVSEGKSYFFRDIVVSEWNGRYQLQFNKQSSIEEIDEEIEIGTITSEFTGAMVGIQTGSGLIRRCPECKRALTKGMCQEHGRVKGEYDLRIKAIFDDGETLKEAILNREITEYITKMSLDEAIELASENLEPSIVFDKFKQELPGKYYRISGVQMERYILVDSIEPVLEINTEKINNLIELLEAE